jgi:hypothetical protein
MFQLENSNYNLEKITFHVDKMFNEKIKEPFENSSFFYIIVGRPGSGKTSLLINMLNDKTIYRKVFSQILVCMPKSSRQSLKNNIFDVLPSDQLFDELDESILHKIKQNKEIFEEEKEMRQEKGKTTKCRHQLLILDDITAHLKNRDNEKMLIELATNRRHYNLSIILLVQFLRSIPRPIRFFGTSIIFFKPSNNLDTGILKEEYITLTKDTFERLMNFVFEDSHDFLIINKNKNTYYKKLQKILFDESK